MNITLPQITQRTRNLGDRVHRDESVFTAEYDDVVVQRAILSGKIVIVKNRRSVGYPATAATEVRSPVPFISCLPFQDPLVFSTPPTRPSSGHFFIIEIVVTKTFTRFSELLRLSTTLCQLWQSTLLVGTHMIASRTLRSIPLP